MNRTYELRSNPKARRKVYNIDSRNRQNTSTGTSEFTIDLGAFDGPIESMELMSAEIPNSMYVFTASNNVITFNEGASNLTATITPGTYTVDDLITEIKTQMDSAGTDTYTVSFNETTKKLTIASSGTVSLLFSEANSPYKQLGWTNTDTSTLASHTAPNSINLEGENALFISLRDFSLNGSQGGQSKNGFSFKVPINTAYGNIVFYNENSGFNQKITTGNNSFKQPLLFVQLVNYRGEIVDLQGLEWSFAIRTESYRSNY